MQSYSRFHRKARIQMNRPMYVLLAGVTDVGFSVRGVFDSIALAREAAVAIPKSNTRLNWREVSHNKWQCVDEYVLIEEYELNLDINSDRPVEFDDTMRDRPNYFQDDFSCEPAMAIESISDSDLVNIWQAQRTV